MLEKCFRVHFGVFITETLGHAWHEEQTDITISGSGIVLLDNLVSTTNASGYTFSMTAPAVSNKITTTADLVKPKSSGCLVAVVCNLTYLIDTSAVSDKVLQRGACA